MIDVKTNTLSTDYDLKSQGELMQFKKLVKLYTKVPIPVRVSVLGVWVAIVNALSFIPHPIRLSLMFVLLLCQYLSIRKPLNKIIHKSRN